MKILVIHNHYLERGGEDEVVAAEIELLKEHGHTVIVYEKSNKDIKKLPFFKKFFYVLKEMSFSKTVYEEVKEIIKKEKPDIAHVHNIFLRITPSAYLALREENVPIVQTLHNFKFVCLNGTLFNNGKICEKCKNKRFFNGVIRKCFRESFILSCVMARILYKEDAFLRQIDSYIALSQFSMNKFIEFRLDKQRIFLKSNFLMTEPNIDIHDYDYGVFVGRLVDYKGIRTLMEAYKMNPSCNLKIVGVGPLEQEVSRVASTYKNMEWLGRLDKDSVFEVIKNSSFLVFPSEWYEMMGVVMLESFVLRKPVLASNLGAVKEYVLNGVNGILFEAGNAKDLAAKVLYLMSHERERIEMGKNAYKIYRKRFDKEKNYQDLIGIYTKIISLKKR